MTPVWLVATYAVGTFIAFLSFAAVWRVGLAVALLRGGVALLGAIAFLPLGHLLLALVFPHLADPSNRLEQLAGTAVNATIALAGVAWVSRWYSNVERSHLRKSINLSRTEMRRQDAEALRTAQALSERDPTLKPLVEQLRRSQRARREIMETEELFTSRRDEANRRSSNDAP